MKASISACSATRATRPFAARRARRTSGIPKTPGSIREKSSGAKIVISLRDPVERAYAFYWTGVKYGGRQEPFLEAVEGELARPEAERHDTLYVGYSLYADAVARYLDAFDDNVHVLFFEGLNADTRGEVRRLFDALGVDPDVADTMELERHNPFALPRTS